MSTDHKAENANEPLCESEADQLRIDKLCIDASVSDKNPPSARSVQPVETVASSNILLKEENDALLSNTILRVPVKVPEESSDNSAEQHHYMICQQQFNRHLKHSDDIEYRLCGVEVVINPALRKRYQEHRDRLSSQGLANTEFYVFHGTSSAAIDLIAIEGFKIGGVDVPSCIGAALGPGIYSTENPNLAMRFIKENRRKRQLILARVCPSPEATVVRSESSDDLDSHIAQLVVQHRDHIIPAYIVHFEEVPTRNRWKCEFCTFLNESLSSVCSLCANTKVIGQSEYGISQCVS